MSRSVVYIVDDDESFLTAVSRMLRLNGFETRTFSTAEQLLEAVQVGCRGCVLADLSLPGMSGFELQQRLAVSPAPMPVVFLTGQGDIPLSVKAMRQGAVDFLEKCVAAEDLLQAIRVALARDEAESTARHRVGELRARFARLTTREHQVLHFVVEGKMIKEIAAALDIHERTVKLHRTAITRKVGVHSAALLATFAQDAGLFSSPQPAPAAGSLEGVSRATYS